MWFVAAFNTGFKAHGLAYVIVYTSSILIFNQLWMNLAMFWLAYLLTIIGDETGKME